MSEELRRAVAIAIESIPGNAVEWSKFEGQRSAALVHIVSWLSDYRKNHGLDWTDQDILTAMYLAIVKLRGTPLPWRCHARRPGRDSACGYQNDGSAPRGSVPICVGCGASKYASDDCLRAAMEPR